MGKSARGTGDGRRGEGAREETDFLRMPTKMRNLELSLWSPSGTAAVVAGADADDMLVGNDEGFQCPGQSSRRVSMIRSAGVARERKEKRTQVSGDDSEDGDDVGKETCDETQ